MQLRPVESYLQLGAIMQFLMHAQPDIRLHGEKLINHGIRNFLDCLEKLEFQISVRAASNLRDLLKDFEKRDQDARISNEECNKLRDMLLSLRNTVRGEAEGFEIFATTPKRLDVQKLLHDPGSLLSGKTFSRLSLLTQYDLREAARCVAFELPTAAAFHTLRATENVLRDFYKIHIRTKRIKDLMWGPIVQDMQKKHPTKKKKIPNADVLLNQLDYIRKQFRNPTQHPEKIYDMDEAQELWNVCVDVIGRMTAKS